ncbi:zinc-ribbon domain-containing protein [Gardnerella sp. 2492-Sm]|uniref:zinc-ribbon domain-containing protein n=1 Tax=unclassified Gardnerella TaxID=2628112 RepID=UPI003D077050
MFCENCGNKINTGDKFCGLCGAPVEGYTYAKQAQEAQPTQPTQPSQPTQPTQSEQQSSQLQLLQQNKTVEDQKTNNKSNNSRRKIAIIITSIVLTIALVLAGAVWYYLKNSATIPSAKLGESANSVAKALNDKGFRTEVIDEFSSEKQGNFLRYVNVKSGSQESTSKVVKILRSKGPGVPAKGVVGASLEKAEKIVKSMGVPVKLHHVPVSEKSTDKIVASSPMPGNAVGKDGVIHIAVGENTDGVPVDVFGVDKDKAKDMLSSKPFSVDLRPKFSSPKYFGKIVGDYPALGTQGNPSSVTLYYGVDASKAKDVVSEPTDFGDKTAYLVTRAGSFVGKWCTKSGNCIKLLPYSFLGSEEKYINGVITEEVDKSGSTADYNDIDVLYMSVWGQDPTDYAIYDKNIENTKYMKNNLISGDTGTVELYAGRDSSFCDGHIKHNADDRSACVNGKYIDAETVMDGTNGDDDIEKDPGYGVGYYYVMQDFMVVVPVGAKFDELLNSGYFVGKGKNQPDLTRPFILRRNPKLYKQTRVDLPKTSYPDWSPFIPSIKGRAVPFAPAPDDSNAYYLVEEPFDWDTSTSESL